VVVWREQTFMEQVKRSGFTIEFCGRFGQNLPRAVAVDGEIGRKVLQETDMPGLKSDFELRIGSGCTDIVGELGELVVRVRRLQAVNP